MFGTFTENALEQYAELVRFRERKVKGGQGTEKFDNLGVGKNDSSFIDSDESMNASDYSETWDYTTCIRSDGSFYGIASAKKCRKGTEGKKPVKERTPKQKQREAIQKRGEKAVTRAKAEKVLGDLQREGAKDQERKQKAFERRAKGDGFGKTRIEQIQVLVGKATRILDGLRERRKRAKTGSPAAEALDARISRLQGAVQRLQTSKQRLRNTDGPY